MLGSGRECTLFNQPVSGVRGWHLHCHNTTIVNALELMAPATFTYAQNDGVDELEFVSSSSGDTTQYLTAYGIDNAGKKISQRVLLTGDTVINTTDTWLYFENAWLDAECAGTVTIDDDGATLIAEIEIGSINTGICQHFNGEEESYIAYFAAGIYALSEGSLNFELRWYPSAADCLDAGDGFEILDRIMAGGGSNTNLKSYNQAPPPHVYPMPIGPLPKEGWLCVYAIAPEADNCEGWCTLQGFDVEVPV